MKPTLQDIFKQSANTTNQKPALSDIFRGASPSNAPAAAPQDNSNGGIGFKTGASEVAKSPLGGLISSPAAANTDISSPSQIPGELGKTFLNFATFPLRAAKTTLYDVPKATIDLIKENGLNPTNNNNAVNLMADATAETAGKILHPFVGIGQFIAGAISSGVSKLTGYQLDPNSEQSFKSAISSIKDPQQRLQTADEVAKSVHKWIVENPDQVMVALDSFARAGKSNVAEDAKDHITNSQAFDVQGSIAKGEIPRESIYSSGNTLRPEFATGRIDDIAQKLDMYKPGLGAQFKAGIDPSTVEMAGNVPESLVKQAHALIDANPPADIVTKAAGATGIPEALNKATDLVKSGADAVKTGIENRAIVNTTAAAQADTQSIANTIAPKLNSAEARNAISEGRVTRGDQSFIFGKQPDIVRQSDEVNQAASTIQRTIPDAAKLNDAQLLPKLDVEIGKVAKNIKGDMQKVPIKLSTTGQVVDTWKALKTTQEAEPEFDGFTGSAKFQKKFESYLKNLNWDITDTSGKFKAPTPKTLDDIWQTRIDYDNSIPANVKNATPNSAPSLQWQKTMWLQNRAILNDAIHDTASGLGDTSRKAFSDMSDMYLAKQNILSKAAVDLEGKPGMLPSNKKQLLKWGLSVGGGLIGLDVLKNKLGL